MRFILGTPSDVPLEVQKPTKLMNLSMNQFGGLAFVIGLLAAIMLVVSTGTNPDIKAVVKQLGLPVVIGLIVSVAVIHELIHALAYCAVGKFKDVSFGLDPKSGMCYAYYPKVVSRTQFIVAALAPFVVLSVLPFLAVAAGLMAPNFMLVIAGTNALGAGGDLLMTYYIVKTVPTQAVIQSSGMSEYWGLSTTTTS